MFDTRILDKMRLKKKAIGAAMQTSCSSIGSYNVYTDHDVSTKDLRLLHDVDHALMQAYQAMEKAIDVFELYSDDDEFIEQQKELYEMKMRDEL